MKVAFLTNENSMHINIKAKYFNQESVYFFAMRCMESSSVIPIVYRENLQVSVFDFSYNRDWKLIWRNVFQMYRIIRKNKIQIVHIIEMTFCEYAIALELLGVRVVLENNGSDVLLAPTDALLRRKYKYAYQLAKAVVQDSLRAQKAGIALGAPRRQNEVIELGIDTKVFCPYIERGGFRKQYNIPMDATVIFSARAFTPLYNIMTIIETMKPIMKAFPNTYYVFCTYRKNRKYQKRIEQSVNVIFLGYLDNEKQMPQIYRDSDIVISIPDSDSSPRTVYEAMACGSNVIVSDLPWVREKFEVEKDLFVVNQKRSEELVTLIQEIIQKKKCIDSVAEYKKVKEILDYKKSAKSLRRLYCTILQGK